MRDVTRQQLRNFNGRDKTPSRREIDNRQAHRGAVKYNELAIRLLMTKSPTMRNSLLAAYIPRPRVAFIANPGVGFIDAIFRTRLLARRRISLHTMFRLRWAKGQIMMLNQRYARQASHVRYYFDYGMKEQVLIQFSVIFLTIIDIFSRENHNVE